jgi:hypothetical protein
LKPKILAFVFKTKPAAEILLGGGNVGHPSAVKRK